MTNIGLCQNCYKSIEVYYSFIKSRKLINLFAKFHNDRLCFKSITYLACRTKAAEGLGFLKSRSDVRKFWSVLICLSCRVETLFWHKNLPTYSFFHHSKHQSWNFTGKAGTMIHKKSSHYNAMGPASWNLTINSLLIYELQSWNCFCFNLQNLQSNFWFTTFTKHVNHQRIGRQILA